MSVQVFEKESKRKSKRKEERTTPAVGTTIYSTSMIIPSIRIGWEVIVPKKPDEVVKQEQRPSLFKPAEQVEQPSMLTPTQQPKTPEKVITPTERPTEVERKEQPSKPSEETKALGVRGMRVSVYTDYGKLIFVFETEVTEADTPVTWHVEASADSYKKSQVMKIDKPGRYKQTVELQLPAGKYRVRAYQKLTDSKGRSVEDTFAPDWDFVVPMAGIPITSRPVEAPIPQPPPTGSYSAEEARKVAQTATPETAKPFTQEEAYKYAMLVKEVYQRNQACMDQCRGFVTVCESECKRLYCEPFTTPEGQTNYRCTQQYLVCSDACARKYFECLEKC